LIQSTLIITTLVAIKSVPIAAVPSTTIDDDEYNDERSIDFIINNNNQQQQQQHIHNNIHIAEEMWQNRCEGCCRILAISTCYLFGGRGIVTHATAAATTTTTNDATDRGITNHHHHHKHNQFYGDIARVLADFFIDFESSSSSASTGVGNVGRSGAGLDVVPSDIGLGIAVLKLVQDQRRYMARKDALIQRQRLQQQQQQQQRLTLSSSSSSSSVLSSYREDGTTLLFRRSIDGGEGMIEDNHATTLLSPPSALPPPLPPPLAGIVDNVDEEEGYQSYSRTVLSPYNSEHYTIIEEGAHFAKYQLAIYTWMLYYYQYPISGTIRLIGRKIRYYLVHLRWFCFKNSTKSSSSPLRSTTIENNYEDVDEAICTGGGGSGSNSRQQSDMMMTTTVVGDNCLHLHELTLIAQAGIESSDVAYASFNSGGFYETPYCIIIDHKWQSIVLSIRGSLTLEDCIVDVLLDPSPLDELGRVYGFEGTGQYCHGGVLECTHWLHDDLMKHRILSTLLLGDTARYPNYTLRIVGHSLGAGIGVILSLMLRGTYPTLRCICYSPPGGLLTWELAKQCSTFVNSFILDSDIVPRLSVNNVEYLRDEVLRLIARVKLSKYEIVRRIFWHGLFGRGGDTVDDVGGGGNANYSVQMTEDMLHPPDCVPESDFSRQLHRFEIMQSERRSSRGLARSVSLYPPGRITHLIKISQSKGIRYQVSGCVTCGASNAGSEYTPVLKENDDFNEIEISPTMWTDHFPNRVCFELEKVAKSFGI
jgi:sn1-specific diacylglycerol lipase